MSEPHDRDEPAARPRGRQTGKLLATIVLLAGVPAVTYVAYAARNGASFAGVAGLASWVALVCGAAVPLFGDKDEDD